MQISPSSMLRGRPCARVTGNTERSVSSYVLPFCDPIQWVWERGKSIAHCYARWHSFKVLMRSWYSVDSHVNKCWPQYFRWWRIDQLLQRSVEQLEISCHGTWSNTVCMPSFVTCSMEPGRDRSGNETASLCSTNLQQMSVKWPEPVDVWLWTETFSGNWKVWRFMLKVSQATEAYI